MVKNYTTKLSGQVGENLVVAELGRRGIVATALAGNAPDIDILAYANGKSVAIQVKSIRKGDLSVNAAH
jgi:Holliday junction resolvase